MRIRRNELLNAENDPEILLTTPCAWNKIYRLDFLKESGLSYPLKRHYEDLTVTPVLLALAKRIVYLDSGPLYIRERLSPKDQLIWRLMKRRLYFVIRLLSRLRKKADSARKRGGAQ